MWNPRNTHEKKLRTHESTVARWHEAHEIWHTYKMKCFAKIVHNLKQLNTFTKTFSLDVYCFYLCRKKMSLYITIPKF